MGAPRSVCVDPVECPSDGFLPACIQALTLGRIHRRRPALVLRPVAANVVLALPVPDRETSGVRSAQCRGLRNDRADHLDVEQIGLELHEEVVRHRTAVHTQSLEAFAGVLLHGVKHVAGLVGDRFQRGADDVIHAYAAGTVQFRAGQLVVVDEASLAGTRTLDTITAHAALRSSGRTQKNSRTIVDQIAAVVLLQQAIDTEKSTGNPPGATVPLDEESP